MAFTTPRDWTAGEFVTEAMMDTHVRDNFLAMGPHLIARKTADESVTSSTTLQDDNDLILPVLANEIWRFNFDLLFSASGAGDLKIGFTFPTGGTFSATSIYLNATSVLTLNIIAATTSPTTTATYAGGTSNFPFFSIPGVYVNGGTAGNVVLQWAQDTSDATATIIKANSTLWAVKLA